ncbi:MAG: SDR family NAD(P)-dependent oxidoreductase, partial [Bacteroidia bacterium]|nr:SDR family NAD(P)-dependent oxidoreductase [Bacteroidia bacterium]
MDIDHNSVVWITGASSGIGEQLVYAYSKIGYYVILSSRKEDQLRRVQNAMLYPEKSKIVPLDIQDYHALNATVKPVLQEIGRLDILVNNAGISHRSSVNETDLSVFERIMNVNFMGSVAMTKAVLPLMIRQKFGNICVISSVNGKLSVPARSGYCSSKHAMHGFFESLRGEVYNDNVHVTMVV